MSPSPRFLTPICPPLENGDQLTRSEFEQRYDATPQLTKAELIEGTVYMPAALRYQSHGKPHSYILGWLATYEAETPNVGLADNATIRLDINNELQPDALLRIETGGQSTVSEDDHVEGAPELIVEIAASTTSIDLNQKLQVYCRNRVQEYLVWRVYDQEFDWFRSINDQYIKAKVDETGIICSQVFPGLWLDSKALLAGNRAQVLKTVQLGMASVEHQLFIDRLLNLQKPNNG
ncbi:MAG: Uma2 family endonuclease [Microcoleaceae cyanobacterium]